MGDSPAVGDLVYEAIHYGAAIQSHGHRRDKKKGLHIDVHLVVIYSSKKSKNNPTIQQGGYDKLIYGYIHLYAVQVFSHSKWHKYKRTFLCYNKYGGSRMQNYISTK